MTDGRQTWVELVEEIYRRHQEHLGGAYPTSFSLTGETDVSYQTGADIGLLLTEVSNALLLECTAEELRMCSSEAVVQASFVSGAAITLVTLDILGARIDAEPAVRVSPATFIQQRASVYGSASPAIYTFYDGNVYFNGTTLVLTRLIEPVQADYELDKKILPPGYDTIRVDMVSQILEAMDYLPEGKL